MPPLAISWRPSPRPASSAAAVGIPQSENTDPSACPASSARMAGLALPVFRAYREGGLGAARRFVERLLSELRTAMVLTGSPNLDALGRVPAVLGPRLRAWVSVEEAHE